MKNVKIVPTKNTTDMVMFLTRVFDDWTVLPSFDTLTLLKKQLERCHKLETVIIPFGGINPTVYDFFENCDLEFHNVILVVFKNQEPYSFYLPKEEQIENGYFSIAIF